MLYQDRKKREEISPHSSEMEDNTQIASGSQGQSEEAGQSNGRDSSDQDLINQGNLFPLDEEDSEGTLNEKAEEIQEVCTKPKQSFWAARNHSSHGKPKQASKGSRRRDQINKIVKLRVNQERIKDVEKLIKVLRSEVNTNKPKLVEDISPVFD